MGIEGVEDKEVRITKEYYDLTQYYETKKSKREKKKRMKALARKKRREEKRRDFVPKTIVARRLEPVVNFRKPKVRAHPIRFLKKEKEEEERETLLAMGKDEEIEDDEPEVVQMQVQPSTRPLIRLWMSSTPFTRLGRLKFGRILGRERVKTQTRGNRGYILDKIEKDKYDAHAKAVSEQKDIYRLFESLDASVVPFRMVL